MIFIIMIVSITNDGIALCVDVFYTSPMSFFIGSGIAILLSIHDLFALYVEKCHHCSGQIFLEHFFCLFIILKSENDYRLLLFVNIDSFTLKWIMMTFKICANIQNNTEIERKSL